MSSIDLPCELDSDSIISNNWKAVGKFAIRPAQLSLDLCQEFMRDGGGQASFLFHISQQFMPILEGKSVEK